VKYMIMFSLLILTSCASRIDLGPDRIYGNNEIHIPKPEIK
jgi:hypothetical protein